MGERLKDGIRIRHATLRSGLYTVQTPKPYPVPIVCPRCAAWDPKMGVHIFKTYHIDLDSEGYAMVSGVVMDRLRTLEDMAGFHVVNTVVDPPETRIDQGVLVDGRRMDPRFAGAYLLGGEGNGERAVHAL